MATARVSTKRFGPLALLVFLLVAAKCAGTCQCAHTPMQRVIAPLSYKLQINLTSEFPQFYGALKFTFKPVQQNLRSFRLESVGLAFREQSIRLDGYEGQIKLEDVSVDPGGITITTKDNLFYFRQYIFSAAYFGDINQFARGLFRSYYKDGSNETKSFVATNLNPTYARTLFPCVDKPSEKSNFSLSLVHTQASKVISVTPIKSTVKLSSTLFQTTFEEMTNTPTHLLSFVMGDVAEMYSDKTLKLTTWGRPSSKELLKLAHDSAVEVMAAAKRVTGLSSPVTQLNIVVLPDLPEDIVGAGLLMLREEPLTFADGLPSRHEQDVLLTMARYVSSSWAGVYVWPRSWSAKWVTDGFANFLKYQIPASMRPEWSLKEQQIADQTSSALLATGNSYLPALAQINEETVQHEIIGDKAASILLMAEHVLNTTFWTGTQQFFRESTNNIIDEIDFIDILERGARNNNALPRGVTVWKVLRSWTTQAGYPTVDVTRDYSKANITVTQRRFFTSAEDRKEQSDTTNEEAWWVPILAKSEINNVREVPFWLVPHETMYIDNAIRKDQWIYFNVNRGGLYRVNYDAENWSRLIRSLKEANKGGFGTLARGHLVSDAVALARAALLPWNTALDAFSYLDDETEYIPWKTILPEVTYLKDRMRGSPILDLFKKYMSHLMKRAFIHAHATVKSSTIHLRKLMKDTISWWACWSGMRNCEELVQPAFDGWIKNETKYGKKDRASSTFDAFSTALCVGVRKWDTQNAVFSKSRSEKIAPLRRVYLKALTCSPTPEYILMSLIHGAESRSDILFYSQALLQYSENVEALLGMLSSPYYFPLLRESVRSDTAMINLLKLLLTKINSQEELIQLQETVAKNARDYVSTLWPSYRMAKHNIAWKTTHLPVIEKWLQTQLSKSDE